MILAAIEGQVLILLIAGAAAVIQWIAQSAKKTKAPPPLPPAPDRLDRGEGREMREMPASPGAALDPEQERMRKFLEALGLPADAGQPGPARPAPRPIQRKPAPVTPVPPIVADAPWPTLRPERIPAPYVPVPPPIPKVPTVLRPVTPRVSRPAQPRHEEEPTSLPVEQIHLPDFPHPKLAPLPEFSTVTSAVSATPGERVRTSSIAGDRPEVIQRDVRRLVRSPNALREAIILREVLGPPRCLQI